MIIYNIFIEERHMTLAVNLTCQRIDEDFLFSYNSMY